MAIYRRVAGAQIIPHPCASLPAFILLPSGAVMYHHETHAGMHCYGVPKVLIIASVGIARNVPVYAPRSVSRVPHH